MAMYIINKSTCIFCGEVMLSQDELFSYPRLFLNKLDPLYFLNDSMSHWKCFERFNHYEEALHILEKWEQNTASNQCVLCKQQISSPKEYVKLPYFKNVDGAESNYCFNQFHRRCILSWTEFGCVLERLEDLYSQDGWAGGGLGKTIQRMRSCD
jgi:uncharacterized CHY-type Zn-finger protein